VMKPSKREAASAVDDLLGGRRGEPPRSGEVDVPEDVKAAVVAVLSVRYGVPLPDAVEDADLLGPCTGEIPVLDAFRLVDERHQEALRQSDLAGPVGEVSLTDSAFFDHARADP